MTQPRILGVDVSNHQGPDIDWEQLSDVRSFAGIKASEGVSFTDPHFARNWELADTNGMARIAYHFGRPSKNTAESEAQHLVKVLRDNSWKPGDLVALDMEDTGVAQGVDLLPWTLRFRSMVESELGVTPGLYSGWWYMEPHGLYARPEITSMWLWLAAYDDTRPAPPPGWDKITIWQYSDHGNVAGISPIDEDEFIGTVDDLKALGLDGGINALEELAKGWHIAELLDSISAHDLAEAQRTLLLRLKRKGNWG